MPTYEWKCPKCGYTAETHEVRMTGGIAPACCNSFMQKQISAVIFDLRGSGFYENEWGRGAGKLGITEQAQRASRDCKLRGLHVANPGGPRPREHPKEPLRWI